MNKKFQKINIEDVLFFDVEVVRASKELVLESEEYNLFQRKTRDRDTDEFLPHQELVELYNKKAALKRGYSKIVTIGVGFVKDGVVYVKDISGNEDRVIQEFVAVVNQFRYCCSFNGIAFDLPLIVGNGMKYFNIAEELNDNFNPSGKKIWNLDNCIDLLEVFKGTHYYPSSLEEVCYHFDIPSPKDDISGAEVSETYYYGDKNKIYEYVKKDVFANINIFRKMQGKEIFTEFVDRSNTNSESTKKVFTQPKEIKECNNVVERLVNKQPVTKKEVKDTLKKLNDYPNKEIAKPLIDLIGRFS
jgi:predicted PolB exonuclease-like 3'-5' exonuclease